MLTCFYVRFQSSELIEGRPENVPFVDVLCKCLNHFGIPPASYHVHVPFCGLWKAFKVRRKISSIVVNLLSQSKRPNNRASFFKLTKANFEGREFKPMRFVFVGKPSSSVTQANPTAGKRVKRT